MTHSKGRFADPSYTGVWQSETGEVVSNVGAKEVRPKQQELSPAAAVFARQQDIARCDDHGPEELHCLP